MNTQMLHEIASQHITEVRESAARCRQASAVEREPRESIRERAGWTLINVGLKLTDPPAKGHSPRPHPAGL
jgi:hypothetical protein